MKNITAKLVQIADQCGYIQKGSENKEQKYRYAAAADVMRKINPALVEAKVVSIPEFSILSEKEKHTSKGAVWQLVTVQCKLQIIDSESGESVTVASLGCGVDPNDKAVAKAQTMALKYAWLTALNIETGDDPEADEQPDQTTFVTSLPNSPTVQEIMHIWQQIGWDVNSLPNYLEERFHRPANQLTEPELTTIANEAKNYLSQRRV